MTDTLNAKEIRKIRQSVRALRIHALVYGAVNAGLFLINILTSFGTWWFIFPLLGWGIGLGAHAFVVLEPGFGQDWEDKMVARIAQKHATGKGLKQLAPEPEQSGTAPSSAGAHEEAKD